MKDKCKPNLEVPFITARRRLVRPYAPGHGELVKIFQSMFRMLT